MFKKIALGVLLALGLYGGYAAAQNTIVPLLTNVAVGDYMAVIHNGQISAQTTYATAGKVTHQQSYVNGGTITGDPAYTFANGVTNWFGHKASTLSTGTFTTEPNPQDGDRECVWLDQTITTLTWTANTGQTIDSNVPAAGTAKIPSCITYSAATATWYASP